MGMEYVTQKKRKGNGITMVKKKSNKFKRHFSHRFMRVPVRAQSQAPRGHTRGTGRGARSCLLCSVGHEQEQALSNAFVCKLARCVLHCVCHTAPRCLVSRAQRPHAQLCRLAAKTRAAHARGICPHAGIRWFVTRPAGSLIFAGELAPPARYRVRRALQVQRRGEIMRPASVYRSQACSQRGAGTAQQTWVQVQAHVRTTAHSCRRNRHRNRRRRCRYRRRNTPVKSWPPSAAAAAAAQQRR